MFNPNILMNTQSSSQFLRLGLQHLKTASCLPKANLK